MNPPGDLGNDGVFPLGCDDEPHVERRRGSLIGGDPVALMMGDQEDPWGCAPVAGRDVCAALGVQPQPPPAPTAAPQAPQRPLPPVD